MFRVVGRRSTLSQQSRPFTAGASAGHASRRPSPFLLANKCYFERNPPANLNQSNLSKATFRPTEKSPPLTCHAVRVQPNPHIYGFVLTVTGPLTIVQHESLNDAGFLSRSFFSPGPLGLQFPAPATTLTAHVPHEPPPPQL